MTARTFVAAAACCASACLGSWLGAVARAQDSAPSSTSAPVAGASANTDTNTSASTGADARAPSDAALEAAAAQWPDRVQLLPLARAGAARPALVAAVWVANEAAPPLPGLLLADAGLGRALEPRARTRAERLGALVLALARRIDVDDGVRALLAERPLYVAPSLGPLDADVARRTFAHDFPSGWLPSGFHGADRDARPGPFPLSTPEAAALSALLAQSQDLAALALFDERAAAPLTAETRVRAATSGVTNGADGDARERPAWSARLELALPAVAGHPLRHAREDLGIAALAIDCGAALGDEALLEHVLELLRSMPRLEIRARATERLGSELWQLDCDVATTVSGVWSEDGALDLDSGVLVCSVESGVLETAARQDASGAAWEALSTRANGCRLARSRHAIGLRVVVRAAAGSTPRVIVRAPRAGEATWTVKL